MTMRVDVASVLLSMGYIIDIDFVAHQETPTTVHIDWLSQQVMPSEATINAYVLPTPLQVSYTKAKALLTADDPVSKKEKGFMAIQLDDRNEIAAALVTLINAIAAPGSTVASMRTAAAAITKPPINVTKAQVRTAIASKIDAGQADG